MNTHTVPIETERKFLIKMPDIAKLTSAQGVIIKSILQTYLVSKTNSTRRIRCIKSQGVTKYVFTEKQRINHVSCYENEFEISEIEYISLYEQRDKNKVNIEKTRYCIPFSKHTLEIDIYDFWNDRAILEIELKDENEAFDIPDFIFVIKEVTDDKRYKNVNLATCPIHEDLL